MNYSQKNILPTSNMLLAYCRIFGLLLLCLLFIQSSGFAQKSKKKKKKSDDKYIHLSGGLQYGSQNDIFIFHDHDYRYDYTIETRSFKTRAALIQLGLSYQSMNSQFLYQEFGITQLSIHQGFNKTDVEYIDQDISENTQGSSGMDFQIGFRYELGKYFTKDASAPINFGIAGALAPSYQFYQQTPASSLGFPFSFSRISMDAALIPRCAIRLSDRLSLVAKVIPSTRLSSFFISRAHNPNLPLRTQRQSTFAESFEFNFAASVQISCSLRQPDQDGKRRKKRRRR